MADVTDLRGFLLGEWRFSRKVKERRRPAEAEGSAVFSPRPEGGLLYEERAVLRVDGAQYEARRTLIYDFPEPDVAQVRFEDGRPFHAMRLGRAPFRATHLCGDDTYKGAFERTLFGWRAIWRVTGPRKDYRMETEYRRP